MSLSIRELSVYLPWNLRCELPSYTGILYSLQSNSVADFLIEEDGFDYALSPNYYLGEIKPILRPLSDLNKEIEVCGKKFVPLDILFPYDDLEYVTYSSKPGELTLSVTYKMMGEVFTDLVVSRNSIDNCDYGVVSRMAEWHFDLFGLIDRGLAVSVHDVKELSRDTEKI